jgi:hypothetical protein
MTLTHSQWLQASLAKIRRYIIPARACNDNRDNSNGNACPQLINKVGTSWELRYGSLLVVANQSTTATKFERRTSRVENSYPSRLSKPLSIILKVLRNKLFKFQVFIERRWWCLKTKFITRRKNMKNN